uniref:Uncharacterized protein n=1 Tax=Arundo donax TaxID=35708 RepID=A0A0A8ZQ07_ARUDO
MRIRKRKGIHNIYDLGCWLSKKFRRLGRCGVCCLLQFIFLLGPGLLFYQ